MLAAAFLHHMESQSELHSSAAGSTAPAAVDMPVSGESVDLKAIPGLSLLRKSAANLLDSSGKQGGCSSLLLTASQVARKRQVPPGSSVFQQSMALTAGNWLYNGQFYSKTAAPTAGAADKKQPVSL